ncbi:hypothetical protein ACWCSD_38860 [Nonomuraea sp. NPDC001684]
MTSYQPPALDQEDMAALAILAEDDETSHTEYAVLTRDRGKTLASGLHKKETALRIAKERHGMVVERTKAVTYGPWHVLQDEEDQP